MVKNHIYMGKKKGFSKERVFVNFKVDDLKKMLIIININFLYVIVEVYFTTLNKTLIIYRNTRRPSYASGKA